MKPIVSPYKTFTFDRYTFDAITGEAVFVYGMDDVVFTERVTFPVAVGAGLPRPTDETLDRALFALHLIAGISYFKAGLPPTIVVKSGTLSKDQAAFWNKLYTNGLGEFFYRNDLDGREYVQFPVTSEDLRASEEDSTLTLSINGEGAIVPIGGGKDSLVAIELLRAAGIDFDLLELGDHARIQEVVHAVNGQGAPAAFGKISRTIDPQLFELNKNGAWNGHVPITTYVILASVVQAILSGRKDVILANERSANVGNVTIDGWEINHQYSKSLEFERDIQVYIAQNISSDVRYFSLLRPLSELAITKRFIENGKYRDVFSSCNKNFKLTGPKASARWCDACPKCAFVFVMMAAFLDRDELVGIFGKDLFADAELVPLYRELLGVEGIKPFECVGEVNEVIASFTLARLRGAFNGTPVMEMFDGEVASKLSAEEAQKMIVDALVPSADHAIPEEYLTLLDPTLNSPRKQGGGKKISSPPAGRSGGVLRLSDLAGKDVVLFGYGKEGQATEKVLKMHVPTARVVILDENEIAVGTSFANDSAVGAGLPRPHEIVAATNDRTIVIKSPGIPWHNATVKALQEKGATFTSATNLFFAERKNRGTIIGVTGTKGKSTTASLLAHTLKVGGLPAMLLGNIGIPMLEAVDAQDDAVFVVELSSYMLSDLEIGPDIAIVLNLYDEHMDYHGSVEEYHKAKLNIATQQQPGDLLLYNAAIPDAEKRFAGMPARKIPFQKLEDPLLDVLTLKGDHNRENASAVLLLARLLGVEDEKIRGAFSTFQPLPHRLEEVAVVDGVTFVNDSISTTPQSALAAIDVYKDRLGAILLGGKNRGYDFASLADRLKHLPGTTVIILPGGEEIASTLESVGVSFVKVADMQRAVEEAKRVCGSGTVCLLSPASPSYGFYKNFEERGEVFRQTVKQAI